MGKITGNLIVRHQNINKISFVYEFFEFLEVTALGHKVMKITEKVCTKFQDNHSKITCPSNLKKKENMIKLRLKPIFSIYLSQN